MANLQAMHLLIEWLLQMMKQKRRIFQNMQTASHHWTTSRWACSWGVRAVFGRLKPKLQRKRKGKWFFISTSLQRKIVSKPKSKPHNLQCGNYRSYSHTVRPREQRKRFIIPVLENITQACILLLCTAQPHIYNVHQGGSSLCPAEQRSSAGSH